ncbi:MAG: hypothetical protein ACK53L_01260 [Pirellulaceae bacterium]
MAGVEVAAAVPSVAGDVAVVGLGDEEAGCAAGEEPFQDLPTDGEAVVSRLGRGGAQSSSAEASRAPVKLRQRPFID